MNNSKKNDIQAELSKLLPQISRVVKMIEAAEENWSVHYDRTDPDDLYLRSMIYQAGDKLDDAARILKRAFADVIEEGVLRRQGNGRYALSNHEFTSGEPIEYLACGLDGDEDRWVATRIEHNGTDYYVANDPDLPLQGLVVRVKSLPRY